MSAELTTENSGAEGRAANSETERRNTWLKRTERCSLPPSNLVSEHTRSSRIASLKSLILTFSTSKTPNSPIGERWAENPKNSFYGPPSGPGLPLKPCLLYISHGHNPGRSQHHHFDSLDPKTSWDQPHSKASLSLSIAASRMWNKDGCVGSTRRELWWHCRGKRVSFMTTVTLITTFSREVGHLPAYSVMMLMASVKPMKSMFLYPRLSISSFHSKDPQATDIKEGTPQHME